MNNPDFDKLKKAVDDLITEHSSEYFTGIPLATSIREIASVLCDVCAKKAESIEKSEGSEHLTEHAKDWRKREDLFLQIFFAGRKGVKNET